MNARIHSLESPRTLIPSILSIAALTVSAALTMLLVISVYPSQPWFMRLAQVAAMMPPDLRNKNKNLTMPMIRIIKVDR